MTEFKVFTLLIMFLNFAKVSVASNELQFSTNIKHFTENCTFFSVHFIKLLKLRMKNRYFSVAAINLNNAERFKIYRQSSISHFISIITTEQRDSQLRTF